MPEETAEQKPPDLVIQIRLNQDGFAVTGEVVKNEPMSIYMLEKAKDTIKAYHLKQNMPIIQKGGVMGFARRIFSK